LRSCARALSSHASASARSESRLGRSDATTTSERNRVSDCRLPEGLGDGVHVHNVKTMKSGQFFKLLSDALKHVAGELAGTLDADVPVCVRSSCAGSPRAEQESPIAASGQMPSRHRAQRFERGGGRCHGRTYRPGKCAATAYEAASRGQPFLTIPAFSCRQAVGRAESVSDVLARHSPRNVRDQFRQVGTNHARATASYGRASPP
jgi:hypothetical protein